MTCTPRPVCHLCAHSHMALWYLGKLPQQPENRTMAPTSEPASCASHHVRVRRRGYRLPAKHVIHTVGPVYGRQSNDASERLLASAYRCACISSHNHGEGLSPAAQLHAHEILVFFGGALQGRV